MFEEEKEKNLKKHEENVTSIINGKISNINQRLGKLRLDINNNLTIMNEVRSKTNNLTFSLETSQKIWETENKKLKEELTNLRSDLNEKDDYLKNTLRILKDRSRRNNIRAEGMPDSENEGWYVTEEKLRKVIKDELDLENVATERAHRVKGNNDNNENNDQTRKPLTVAAKLLNFKDKQDVLHEAKSRKIRNFQRRFFKRNNKKRTLE